MSAPRLNTGDLRNRITIRRSTEQPDGKGGYVTTWSDVSTLWAEVLGLDGRETVMDRVLQGLSVYRVRIRYRDNVLRTDQIRYAAQDLNIVSIADPDGRREQLILMAQTDGAR